MGFEQSPTFKRLTLYNWRQFASVDLEFHPRLTIVTGANGAGKSSLLNLLSRHMGSERPYYSVPQLNPKGGVSYLVGQLSNLWATLFKYDTTKKNEIGQLTYADGSSSAIVVPEGVGLSYQVQLPNQKSIPGVVIAT